MILSLSHIDLDGYVCQLILQEKFSGNISKLNCNYNKIDEYLDVIQDKLSYDKTISDVYITDLSFNESQYSHFIRLADEFRTVQFHFIDHHPIDFNIISKNNISHKHDITKSASKLTSEYLGVHNEFIEATNAFDMWDTASKYFKYGLMLNTLFWDYKNKHFCYMFKNMNKPNERAIQDYKNIINKKDKHFKALEAKGLLVASNDVLISFTDKFLNWIQLDYPNKGYYINATSYGTINIRISDFVQDVKAQCLKDKLYLTLNGEEWFVDMGGHLRAFGISHNDHGNSQVIVDCVKMIFEDIKEIEKEYSWMS